MRVSFENMPVEGTRDPRSTARIINQAMLGKINAVFDFTIPANALDSGNYVVRDVRISEQAIILLEPQNLEAELATLFVVNQTKGQFEMAQASAEFRSSASQVSIDNGSIPGGIAIETLLPFDTSLFERNCTNDLINNRVIFNTSTVLQWNYVVSGNYAIGTTYEFGFRLFDNLDVEKNRFRLFTSTSNQNNTVAVSGSGLISGVVPGDYIDFYGDASGTGGVLTYDLLFSFYTAFNSILHVADEMKFRALVIG